MSPHLVIAICALVGLVLMVLIGIALKVSDIFQKVEELHKKIMDEDPPKE